MFFILPMKAMAPHSSTLAWKIPWMEEPGRLQSMGSLRVGHTERLHFHFSLSCIGEGNGNPLQCSCLENPRDGGAWWAAVYGVDRVGHDWSDLAAAAAWSIKNCSNLANCDWIILVHFSKLILTWKGNLCVQKSNPQTKTVFIGLLFEDHVKK